MPTVRRYPSPILAQHAAAYLRQHGIVATVHGQLSAFPGVQGLFPRPSNTGTGAYSVIIDNAAQQADALLLLEEFDRSPVEPDADWEADALPDLSLLDPDLAPPCPSCAQPLPLDAATENCPACGVPVDVPALLADRYGPELLAACIPVPDPTDLPAEILDAADLHCPTCGYALRGLPQHGACPECGEGYSKQDMLAGP